MLQTTSTTTLLKPIVIYCDIDDDYSNNHRGNAHPRRL